MKKYLRVVLAAGAFVTMSLIGQEKLMGQEKKIERTALPPAVEKTVRENTKGASIKGFSTEREHGVTVFEAETIVDGHTRDLQIAADGTLNEIEEEVAFDSLPPTVRAALTAKAGPAKIVKVESLMKKGILVAYEAAILNGAQKGGIQVGARRKEAGPRAVGFSRSAPRH